MPRQTNFSAGELAPLLWGRTDLPVYAKGLRTCRNFFVSKQGAAVSRPGSALSARVKLGTKVRLIPFVFSDSQSYAMEFGAGYIRFHSGGGLVIDGTGTIVEVVTPYTVDDLPNIQTAQIGNLVVLTHPSYEPRTLTRTSHTVWALATVSFDRPAPGFPSSKVLLPLPLADATHPAREWKWAITEIRRDTYGRTTESKATVVTLDSAGGALPLTIPVYSDRPVILQVPLPPPDANLIAYRVYRGRGGIFGWVGDMEGGQFTDTGQEPDYAHAPPRGVNPFKILKADGTLDHLEKPAACAFFEERLILGGTTERPGFVFASATGDYVNFDDERAVLIASQALKFELASNKREDVRSLIGHKRLVIGTNGSIYSMGGTGGDPLAPDNVQSAKQDEVGSARTPAPLVVDGAILVSRAKGTGVRGLLFSTESGGYAPADLSEQSQHLFLKAKTNHGEEFAIAEWAYAEDPWGVVWAVREDGALLSFTYVRDRMAAWARHDTDGNYESVCSIPEGDEDAVYVVVSRQGLGRFVERLFSRVPGYFDSAGQQMHFAPAVDCALVGAAVPAMSLVLTGLNHLEGRQVYAMTPFSPVYGPLTVVGGKVTLPEQPSMGGFSSAVLYVGLGFTADLETLDVAAGDARTKQKTVTRVGFEVDEARGLQVGQDFDHLKEWRQRTVADSYNGTSAATALVTVPVSGTWDTGARAALRQTWPLSVIVVGLTREIDVGG